MTPEQLRPLLARLSLSFGQPFGLTAAGADGLVQTWLTVVGDCDLSDLTRAVDQWIRTQKKWPAPAMIREDTWAITRARKPIHHQDRPGFCPRCLTRDLIELPNGRLMPLHADNCPGLHEYDRLDQTHAYQTGRPVWRNGIEPKPALPAPEVPVQPHELTLTT